MSFEDIDIDSWGKPEDQVRPSDKPKASRSDRPTGVRLAVRRPRAKAPRKQITPMVLLDAIKKSKMGIAGEKQLKHFILKRHKNADVASLVYIIELIKQLKEGGYEI